VHGVELDGEAVLLDTAAQRLHLLNVTATLVWNCLDGKATVGAVATDLSDELAAAHAVVLADTLEVVERFAREGLLENVEASPSTPRGEEARAQN
jgi:hypothetical protein